MTYPKGDLPAVATADLAAQVAFKFRTGLADGLKGRSLQLGSDYSLGIPSEPRRRSAIASRS